MAKEKKVSRKDSKGRVLRKGESERKDGTYMYRYMDERKKRKSVYAKTLPELREKALRIERDRLDDIRLSTDYTVDQLVKLYFSLCQNPNTTAITSRITNQNAYKNHIKNSWLANKKIKEVKHSDITLFYNELSKKIKNNTIAIVHKVLSQSFKIALDDQMIRTNPASGALKMFPRDSAPKDILTQQQLDDLITYTKNSTIYYRWYPLIVVLAETMIRGGELCGLTWDDVDLKNKIIKIDHQIQYKQIDGKYTLFACPPKTKKGYRNIPLTTNAYKAFIKQKEFQLSLNLRSTMIVDGYHNFVFPTKRGKPNHIILIDNMLRNLENRYNTEHKENPIPHLSCHVFRHTGCALTAKKMFKLGLDPIILQQWMGHSSLKMTLELYNHALESDYFEAINQINNLSLS